ncbi:MAG: hypothetical protein Q4G61_06185 [Tissierellia bacterium]|nr:hypothetical protein [Tissierellia bacterium]
MKDKGLLQTTLLFYLLMMAILLYALWNESTGAPAFIYNNF